MKEGTRMCDCCGKKEALNKDFREQGGTMNAFHVCNACFALNDKAFWKTYNKKEVK